LCADGQPQTGFSAMLCVVVVPGGMLTVADCGCQPARLVITLAFPAAGSH
jgi:hypothetical protein